MANIYFLRRNGGWFRPKAEGYTTDLAQAGLFTESQTRSYADCEGVEVIKAETIRNDIEDAAAFMGGLGVLCPRPDQLTRGAIIGLVEE